MKPLCYDLFCGLGGWAEGFLAEGWDVVGFDIEKHDWGTGTYPGELRIRDVMTIHGSELADADGIVASPPCQAYSYRAMPWKRAKALPPPSNELFDACFRIQREACEAASRHIPMIVENVKGAQKWVGRSACHFGSYHLWGDVPALMPITTREGATKNSDGSWFNVANNTTSGVGQNPDGRKVRGLDWSINVTAAQRFREGQKGIPHRTAGHWTNPAEHENGVKGFTPNGEPFDKNKAARMWGSKSDSRKAASAQIAKIPFPLGKPHSACLEEPSDRAALACSGGRGGRQMSKHCSVEHRRKVGEGVKRAWERRRAEGFVGKGIVSQIRAILHTNDPVWAVKYLEKSHRKVCFRLQQCTQTHKLGLGGENVADLVCDRLDELLGKSSKAWK